MVEAVRTSISTFEIWAIVVVAIVCLAIWLVGISVADSMQTRQSRRLRQLREAGPALGGATAADGRVEVPGQRRADQQHNPEVDWRAEAPTRPDLLGGGQPSMPAQRAGEADRPERSLAGPDDGRTDDDPTALD